MPEIKNAADAAPMKIRQQREHILDALDPINSFQILPQSA